MSERRLITSAEFRTMVKKRAPASDLDTVSVFKATGAVDLTAQTVEDARELSFVLSNANLDREGDSIASAGWRLDNYKRNPVVLWAHDHAALPVGKSVRTFVDADDQLKSVNRFTSPELYAFGAQVHDFVKAGFLSAVSVGFQPEEFVMTDTGVAFSKQDLLEHSVCPVPAHPEALVLATSKGLNVGELSKYYARALDLNKRTGKIGEAERAELHRLKVITDPSGRSFFSMASAIKLPDVIEFDDEPVVPIKRLAPRAKHLIAADALLKASTVLREGRRHSAADQQALDQAHSALVQAGATCAGAKSRKGKNKTWSDEAREAAAEARRQNAASQEHYDNDREAEGSAAWQASADAASNATIAANNASQAATEASQRAETSGSAADHATAAAAHADAQAAHQSAAQANAYADGSEDGEDTGGNVVTSSVIEDHTSQANTHGEHASRHGSQAGKALNPRVRQRIAAMNTIDISDDIDLSKLSAKDITDAIQEVVIEKLMAATGRVD